MADYNPNQFDTPTTKTHRAVRKIEDPRGIGGVSATYYLHQQGDAVQVGPLNNADDSLTAARTLAEVTQTRWDVVEEKITHTTIAAFGVDQQ